MISISKNQRIENIRNDNGWMIRKYNSIADPIANTFTRISKILISGLVRK
jgi:hypothetical protein